MNEKFHGIVNLKFHRIVSFTNEFKCVSQIVCGHKLPQYEHTTFGTNKLIKLTMLRYRKK